MTILEWATWVLTGFTGVLVLATSIYAYLTYKMLKASESNQRLLEYQNANIGEQNHLIKEQTGVLQNQASALFNLSQTLNHLTLSIGNLPYDMQEIKDKMEKNKKIT